MKKSFKDLFGIFAAINAAVPQKDSKNWTKVQKKLVKISERLTKYVDLYNERRDAILLDNALEKDGKLEINADGTYAYSKEGEKKKKEQLIKLFTEEFDFTPIPVISPEGLAELPYLKGWLSGVDFPETQEEEEEEL